MLKTEIVAGDLPFRIEIDGLSGVGTSPSRAAMAALSAGRKIPIGERNRKAAASYIFWNYETNPDWVRLIHILEQDTFE